MSLVQGPNQEHDRGHRPIFHCKILQGKRNSCTSRTNSEYAVARLIQPCPLTFLNIHFSFFCSQFSFLAAGPGRIFLIFRKPIFCYFFFKKKRIFELKTRFFLREMNWKSERATTNLSSVRPAVCQGVVAWLVHQFGSGHPITDLATLIFFPTTLRSVGSRFWIHPIPPLLLLSAPAGQTQSTQWPGWSNRAL